MKGLILCAGRGTRLQPLTLTRPKCMIPINGEAVVVSIITKLVSVGITEIGIVVNDTQGTIKEVLGNGEQLQASLTFLIQKEAKGLANAVQSASTFIGNSPFLVMLGDNLIEGDVMPLIQSLETGGADGSILLAKVEDPRSYGVAVIEQERIVKLEEKPDQPQSDLAIVGAYAFRKTIWPILEQLAPSARGEYELTDAIQQLIDRGYEVRFNITSEPYFDVGTHDRWLAANRYKMEKDPNNFKAVSNATGTNVQCIPPVQIHPTATVHHSVIGPHVYIGPGSVVEHCTISNSILTDHVYVSHIHAEGSLFGSRVHYTGAEVQKRPGRYILGDFSIIYSGQ